MSADQVKYTVTIQPPRTWEQTHAPRPAPTEPPARPKRVHPKPTRAEQRELHRIQPAPPASRSQQRLELLRAKATVCDRYMRWLDTSTRDDRLLLATALQHVRKLEQLFKGGW